MNATLIRGLGILFILNGSAWYYSEGHKDSGLTIGLSFFFVLLGWSIVSLSVVGRTLLKGEKVSFGRNKLKWIKIKATHAIIYLTIGGVTIANILLVSKLIDNRVRDILAKDPTNFTIGTVTEIESRNTRGGPKDYAIIVYSADGREVQQAVFNYNGHFFVGQKLEIIYSIDNPEMFQLKEEFVEKSRGITTPMCHCRVGVSGMYYL